MPPQSHNPKEWSNQTTIELFNSRHSSLKNVIERSFVASKNHFFILRHIFSFTNRKQANIVIAFCVIHNYIRDQDMRNKNFSLYGDIEYLLGPTQEKFCVVIKRVSLLRNSSME